MTVDLMKLLITILAVDANGQRAACGCFLNFKGREKTKT
jgi:hypothetical protein